MTRPDGGRLRLEGCRNVDLYPLTASGPSLCVDTVSSDLLSVFTHTHTHGVDSTGSTRNNGGLPTRLPQSKIRRIGFWRRQALGVSTGSATLQSSNDMLKHTTSHMSATRSQRVLGL